MGSFRLILAYHPPAGVSEVKGSRDSDHGGGDDRVVSDLLDAVNHHDESLLTSNVAALLARLRDQGDTLDQALVLPDSKPSSKIESAALSDHSSAPRSKGPITFPTNSRSVPRL